MFVLNILVTAEKEQRLTNRAKEVMKMANNSRIKPSRMEKLLGVSDGEKNCTKRGCSIANGNKRILASQQSEEDSYLEPLVLAKLQTVKVLVPPFGSCLIIYVV